MGREGGRPFFIPACGRCAPRRHLNPDSACFHAQQCAEKYLKARLQEAGLAFPKTHDLLDLLKRFLAVEPAWTTLTRNSPSLSLCGRFPLSGGLGQQGGCAECPVACRAVRRAGPAELELEGLK